MKKWNTDTQKAIMINIIENYDLSEFYTKATYFANENITEVFNTIVRLHKLFNTITTDVNTIVQEINKETNIISLEVVSEILKKNSTYEQKWLDNITEEWKEEVLTTLKIKWGIDGLNNGNIKEVANAMGITKNLDEDIKKENDLQNTPFIDDFVYDKLPNFYKEFLSFFDNKREKDVVLTSSFATMSILFDNAYMKWFGKKEKANINVFIAAPAANGKGNMDYAKSIIDSYIKNEIEQNKISENIAKQNKMDYVPKYTMIPADSSAASALDIFASNNGKGLIYTNEADSMLKNRGQDWGNYDTMIRQSFHQETISSSRKTGGLTFVNKPYLSTLMSGTPDQLMTLFDGKAENGLFSRFLIYVYDSKSYWKYNKDYEEYLTKYGVSSLDEIFENKISNKLFDIFRKYNYDLNKEVNIQVNKKQQLLIDTTFEDLFNKYTASFDSDFASSVKRLASICRRLLIILSIVRNYEYVNENPFERKDYENIEVEDVDVEIVLSLIKTYIIHTTIIYNSFALNNLNQKRTIIRMDKKEEIYNSMNTTFKFNDFVEYGKEYNIYPKTIQRYLNNLIDNNIIIRINKGTYTKIKE